MRRIAKILIICILTTPGIFVPIRDVLAIRYPGIAPKPYIISLSGQVLNANTNAPLSNVTLTIAGTNQAVTTNAAGIFTFNFPPLGPQIVFLDARTTTAPGSWPIFPIPANIKADENTFPAPIWLVPLDTANGTPLTASNFNPTTGQVLQTITVISPTAPGVSITIPQGTFMRNPWSTLRLGDILSITRVPSNRPPQPLPNNSIAGMMVIAQPGGILFSDASNNPVKVPMQFPNVSNEFTNGSQVSLFSALGGQFGTMVNGGPMTVQGGNIIPNMGTGISHFSCEWTPPSPPIASTNTGNNPQGLIDPSKICPLPIGSKVNPLDGNLIVEHVVAAHPALGNMQGPQLIYNSSTAYPHPVITSQANLTAGAPVPLATSVSLSVGGMPQGSPVFYQGSTQMTRQARTFDASNLLTGQYPYTLNLTNHYSVSAFSTVVSDNVLVNNKIRSPFGAGWDLAGLQRVHLDDQGNALITDGLGGASFFKFIAGAAVGQRIPIEDLIATNSGPQSRGIAMLLGAGNGTFSSQLLSQGTMIPHCRPN